MCTFPDPALRQAFGTACLRKTSPSIKGSGQQARALGCEVRTRATGKGQDRESGAGAGGALLWRRGREGGGAQGRGGWEAGPVLWTWALLAGSALASQEHFPFCFFQDPSMSPLCVVREVASHR